MLEKHVLHLREELNREREERNYFQLERDKMHTFWDITRRQLEEKKAELRNKDRQMEEAEERHQVEIKVYKQKVKHLLYEHQENLTELKAGGMLSLKLAQKDHWAQEMEMWKENCSLKVELKEQELANEVVVKNKHLKQEQEITRLCNDFERQVREIEARYAEKMHVLRNELDLRRKTEIHEVEERKNSHISQLMRSHEKAFNDMKNYYNDITLKNLELISLLKEQIEDLQIRTDHLEREKADALLQNKQLNESLQQAQGHIFELEKKLVRYDKDKEALTNAKAHLKITQKERKDLQWEHEVLEQRFRKVQVERDELYQKFTKAIHEVQQKTGFKNLLLERKLTGLLDVLEKKEVELSEVFAASKLDQGALTLVSHKLEVPVKAGLGGRGCLGLNADLGACESLILHGWSCCVTHSWYSQRHARCRRALQLSLESRARGCWALALLFPSGGACFEENGTRPSSTHQHSAAEQPLHAGPPASPDVLCMGSHSWGTLPGLTGCRDGADRFPGALQSLPC
ncbi:dynein regulatory complex subunit 4 isoform 3-T3 [Amazona ochrocephala]